MKVAIIGAGNVGSALAGSFATAGHDVTLSARHPEHARGVAAQVGAHAAETRAAARDADVVVLAVPYPAVADVADEIREAVAGKPVVDVTNPLTADGSGLAVEGTSAAEQLQERLPGAGVVKAFNTLFASVQAAPSPDIDGYVAGDDPAAKQRVISLIESIGFTPLDVGPLRSARVLEGMAFVNIGLNAQHGWDWTSAWKLER